jgi:peptidyl-prolyl cis-trans isomerase SurA
MRLKIEIKKIAAIIGSFLVITSAISQTKKVVADKIIGQVGDKIVLRSEILNAILDYKRGGREAELPPNAECAFLEGQLIRKAMVLQAEKDSLNVSEEDIENELDKRIRASIYNYGGKEALEEIAQRTIYQLKEDFREGVRDQKLEEQMRGKILENIKITPNEVKAYFAKFNKDSLPYYESEVEISQIVSVPKASKEIEEYAIKQLYEYKRQAEAGIKKFEQLAKLYSDDKGTEQMGGILNMNRTAKEMDPTFTAAAFRLKEGQISPVIKSKFGFHIIKMVSRAGDDAQVRHLLKIPEVTDDEIAISKVKLDSARKKLISGQITFGEAVSKFSDDEGSKFNGGNITSQRDGSSFLSIDELDREMVAILKDLKVGEFSQPQVYTDERGRRNVRIVYLRKKTQPHRENLLDDYNRIADKAIMDKKQKALETWFKEHLPSYYIMLDKDFKACEGLQDWWKYVSTASN